MPDRLEAIAGAYATKHLAEEIKIHAQELFRDYGCAILLPQWGLAGGGYLKTLDLEFRKNEAKQGLLQYWGLGVKLDFPSEPIRAQQLLETYSQENIKLKLAPWEAEAVQLDARINEIRKSMPDPRNNELLNEAFTTLKGMRYCNEVGRFVHLILSEDNKWICGTLGIGNEKFAAIKNETIQTYGTEYAYLMDKLFD